MNKISNQFLLAHIIEKKMPTAFILSNNSDNGDSDNNNNNINSNDNNNSINNNYNNNNDNDNANNNNSNICNNLVCFSTNFLDSTIS